MESDEIMYNVPERFRESISYVNGNRNAVTQENMQIDMGESLGVDEKLNEWIDSKIKSSLLNNKLEASEQEIQAKKCNLYETQLELKEKYLSILRAIPEKILVKLPGYDSKIFHRLKLFNEELNMKTHQTDRKLSAYQEPEDNLSPICEPNFIDPNISPPQQRHASFLVRDVSNQQTENSFEPKRPLSTCFGPQIAENTSVYCTTTTQVENATSHGRERDFVKEDGDGLINMDMQGFLNMYGDNSEEFFSNNNNNNIIEQESPNTEEFLQQHPDVSGVLGASSRWTTDGLLESNSDTSMLQLIGNVRNDGDNKEFNTLEHPHCRQMVHIFRTKFGLHLFRPNQLSAINAAILGHDCFVLMPTGGGKSLCYQLPALLSAGVTIVISPLRSLIIDQTQKLLSLDIPAMYMTGDQTENQQASVYRKLYERDTDLRLLYVTPEKISLSAKFMETLNFLYQQKRLVRFVIDEVHCVSQWGHDFRPDYKKLSMLRQRFPGVPLMALTATATHRVRSDILHQLHIQSPKWFISSFNRPNLRYTVIPKKAKSACNQVTEIIRSKFANDCGIIYCISRKDCDDLADALTYNGLKALSYHAGLPDRFRIDRQSQWISEKVKIICATIAFGMGIDKPNVRFVIHAAMPKSIEGYYQESGRAGRDGEPADCILLYSYGDVYRYRNLMERNTEHTNPEALKTHLENLNRMVHFCDNLADCRRALQLNYFGEQFDRQDCIANKETMCDNCKTYDQFVKVDVTEHAVNLVQLVQILNMARPNCVTMLQLVDIYKGSEISQIAYKLGNGYLQWYGLGNSMTKYEIERLLHILVVNGYLCENMEPNNGIVCAYVVPGRLARELVDGGHVQIFMQKKAPKKPAVKPIKPISLSPSTQMSALTNAALKDIEQRCYEELMAMVNGIAGALDVSANSIMNMVALQDMSKQLPTTQTAMLKIPHVTKANFEKYGKALLDITQKYANEKKKLLEEENEIQNEGQVMEFSETDSENEYPINSYSSQKRSRGNRGRAKRFKPTKTINKYYSGNFNGPFNTAASNNAPRNAGNNSRANFTAWNKRKPTVAKKNNRGRGGNIIGRGGRAMGPGLCDLTKKTILPNRSFTSCSECL